MSNKFPDYMMKYLRQRDGLEPNDTSMDDMINEYPPQKAFKEVCNWNGFIDWGSCILGWVEDAYGLKLEE